MRIDVLVTSLVLVCVAAGNATAAEYRLYFLGGQSNMDGYGYVEELPAELVVRDEAVRIFRGRSAFDDDPAGGVGIWAGLEPGFGTGFETDGDRNRLSDRFGPELLFGLTMAARRPGARIAIVKYAVGGTGLADGVGYGNWYPEYVGEAGINQYDHALATLRNALSVADIDGDGQADRLVPAGIVWMQGEADAHHSQEAADAYEANLERLMDLLRAALRRDDLPVVIGRITDSGIAEDGSVMDHIETVQRAQEAFVASDACAAYVTETDRLAHSSDAWHYDTAGFIELGRAFAAAMQVLESDCGVD